MNKIKSKMYDIVFVFYYLLLVGYTIWSFTNWEFIGLIILSIIFFVNWTIGITRRSQFRISELENECKNIRGRIELDKENIESELEVIFDCLSDRINFLSKRLSKIELTNHIEEVTKDLEKFEDTIFGKLNLR